MTLTITACKVITVDGNLGLRFTDFSQIEICKLLQRTAWISSEHRRRPLRVVAETANK